MIAGTGKAVTQFGCISKGHRPILSPLHGSRLQVLRGDCSVRNLDFNSSQIYDTHYTTLSGAPTLYSLAPNTAVTTPERPASSPRPDR